MIGNKTFRKLKNKNTAFTLVDLLISIAIFASIMAIIVSIFVTVIGAQKRAHAQQDVIDSARFALESMSRAIRQSTIVSANPSRLEIDHPIKGNIVYDHTGVGGLLRENGEKMTSDDVRIAKFTIIDNGLATNDGLQPRVTIVLGLRSQIPAAQEDRGVIYLQTTVTPRKLQTE